MASASESLTLHLQVGRFLRGPLLAFAVILRNLPMMLLDGAGGDLVAPAWVIVRDRSHGSKVLRVAAGRDFGAGEAMLTLMQEEAAVMDRETFVARWAERQ